MLAFYTRERLLYSSTAMYYTHCIRDFTVHMHQIITVTQPLLPTTEDWKLGIAVNQQ